MAVTLQQIAECAGVSRGTVDRALNNRGRIRPEVAEKIKRIAEELGYQPSLAGRALVMARRKLKIGVIIQSAETPFMKNVMDGILAAKQEVESLGGIVEIHEVKGVNPQAVIDIISRMRKEEIHGIALSSAEDPLLRQTIDDCVENYKIPVVTFNGDLDGTKRMCYVGQDARRSGKVAAGLMSEIIDGGEVAIISGHPTNPALNERADGFAQIMKEICPEIEVLENRYAYDDDWVSEKLTEELVGQHPKLKGIYVTGSGCVGVCKALVKLERGGIIKVIGNDFLIENLKWLEKGVMNFLIGQDGHIQGYEPVMLLFHKLFESVDPEKEYNYTEIVIKTRYNI